MIILSAPAAVVFSTHMTEQMDRLSAALKALA
jgi:hypothetical protein